MKIYPTIHLWIPEPKYPKRKTYCGLRENYLPFYAIESNKLFKITWKSCKDCKRHYYDSLSLHSKYRNRKISYILIRGIYEKIFSVFVYFFQRVC